ncbi:MAG: cytochrome B5 [Chloroflexi bacterium]|nr:cytochrome B5 [Chloroflexota bacterium]
MRVFTLQDLSRYNGRDGNLAYVAYRGLVYDVSGSYFFRGGRHWVRHNAGSDLSDEIDQAPHDESLLQRFPVVGSLTMVE